MNLGFIDQTRGRNLRANGAWLRRSPCSNDPWSGPAATLQLAGSGAGVRSTTTGWTETSLIYNNASTYGATVATISKFAAGTWLSYNVTSLVTTSGQVTFMYSSASATPIRSPVARTRRTLRS